MIGIIFVIIVAAVIIGMIISAPFRTAAANVASDIAVIVFGVTRQYALFAAVTVAVMSFWMFLALMIGNPIFSGIVFLAAITMFFIVWLPLGIVLRIFGANATVVPPAVRSLFALMAFIGFLAVMTPSIFTLKTVLIASLVAVLFATVSSKINILGKLLLPIVVVMCALAVWQIVAPDSFRASDRHRKAIGALFTTGNDRGAFRKETRAASTFAVLIEGTSVVYDKKGNKLMANTAITALPFIEGTLFLLCNQKEEVFLYQGQSFTEVRMQNENGTFVDGQCFWIESNLLRIGTRDELVATDTDSRASDYVEILRPGINSYQLKKIGDETPWLKYSDCIRYSSVIKSSEGNGYKVVYFDRTEYSSTDVLPYGIDIVFKLVSIKNVNQLVTIDVTLV